MKVSPFDYKRARMGLRKKEGWPRHQGKEKRGKFRFLVGFSRGGEASIGVGNKKKSLTARVSFFGLK